jgi:hypothetical protein
MDAGVPCCTQHQLAPSDVRRKAEPDYRQGWNSYSPRSEACSGGHGNAPSRRAIACLMPKGSPTGKPMEPGSEMQHVC